ncbi:muramidase [Aspergillus heteromorphus CBS 117.55]|uniref:Muramidase n=1 Tax=Aspergillus heteromorphus CBS 117.55 TaxID=1448321 RepID=A0A317V9P5_9EURO|nr:muramidase [Aspergillus heteromorphus CBS 117.55]PWY69717.1 muramidase [Aspergillus heteromorphus CBS 117.55]
MRFTQFFNILAAGSLVGITAAAPLGTRTLEVSERGVPLASRSTDAVVTVSALAVKTINNDDGKSSASNSYTMYTGDGSTQDGWPAKSDWWTVNKPLISESCANNGWGADNSATETQDLYDAINEVAEESEVDHRLILAVVMQESKGCVRVVTTSNSVENPGLMQSYEGTGTCYGKETCSKAEIVQMIRDGSIGTAAGYGLASLIDMSDRTTVAGYYRATRMYNSGVYSLESSDNLVSASGATSCYASDIANRLTGWTTAATKCTNS